MPVRVELISQPVVNLDGLARFLNEHGASWPEFTAKVESNLDLGDHDGEWLVELAGRLQDGSLPGGPPADGGHAAYLKDHVLPRDPGKLAAARLGFLVWDAPTNLARALYDFGRVLGDGPAFMFSAPAGDLRAAIEALGRSPGPHRDLGLGLLRAARSAAPLLFADLDPEP